MVLVPLLVNANAHKITNKCSIGGCKVTCSIEPQCSQNMLDLKPKVMKGIKVVTEVHFPNGSRVLYFKRRSDFKKLLLSKSMHCHIENIRSIQSE